MHAAKPPAPISPSRTGVWVGIGAITMSFAAYTSAMLVRQGSGTDWQHVQLPAILYLNTVVLLASSGTLELGRRRLRAGVSGTGWLILTFALGLLFLAGQVAAWRQLAGEGVFLASNPGSGFFYVLTVLHALHLLGGLVALGYAIARVRGPAAGTAPAAAPDGTALYWHFIGVLWLYLLLILVWRL